MKKLLSILLIAILALTVLVSCGGHTHTFSPDWSKNETQHWHDCTDESCTEKADVAAHSYTTLENVDDTQHKKICECGAFITEAHNFVNPETTGDTQHKKTCACGEELLENHDWDEGEVTTAPTPDADGVMTYTCEVCGEEKTEPIEYVAPAPEGMTATEWDNAFKLDFSHYTITGMSGNNTQITYFDG